MFIVTFHGGTDGIQQVYSYQGDGSGGSPYLTAATPPGTTSTPNGFRDIQFLPFGPDGQFYLVNSYKNSSEVFQIAPNATSVPPPFVNGAGGTGQVLCSAYHPFAIAFDAAMKVCYISCQDSNVVVSVGGPNSANSGQPLPINSSLPLPSKKTAYLPGTFVASQIPLLPKACSSGSAVPPAVASHDGGLDASPSDLGPDDTPDNSVRGVALLPNRLYVADEVDDCLRVYDTNSGAYLDKVDDPNNLVRSPTHLLAGVQLVYISVKPSKHHDALVLRYDPSQKLNAVISNSDNLNVESPSGMTFDGNGNFYLADRTKKVVYKFNPDFSLADGNPFISNMPDLPEFILWVNDDWLPSGS
jgi:hypothetical protein